MTPQIRSGTMPKYRLVLILCEGVLDRLLQRVRRAGVLVHVDDAHGADRAGLAAAEREVRDVEPMAAENRPDLRLMESAVAGSSENSESVASSLRIDPRMLARIKRLARSRYLD